MHIDILKEPRTICPWMSSAGSLGSRVLLWYFSCGFLFFLELSLRRWKEKAHQQAENYPLKQSYLSGSETENSRHSLFYGSVEGIDPIKE